MKKDAQTIVSNCQYHYKGVNYKVPLRTSKSTPRTNVPIHCTLCPPSSDIGGSEYGGSQPFVRPTKKRGWSETMSFEGVGKKGQREDQLHKMYRISDSRYYVPFGMHVLSLTTRLYQWISRIAPVMAPWVSVD